MDFKTIFALFSIILCLSSLLVVFLQNSVYSVVYLVLTFLASIIILLLLECEFFAFLFLIIYVGAIAVLFLLMSLLFLGQNNIQKNNDFWKKVGFGGGVWRLWGSLAWPIRYHEKYDWRLKIEPSGDVMMMMMKIHERS